MRLPRFSIAAAALLSIPVPAAIAASDIVISQYYEGASFNKLIELHNPTAGAITLTGYRLTLWANAAVEGWKMDGATPSANLDLTAVTIPSGGYFLLSHSTAAKPDYVFTGAGLPAGQKSGSVINFNGNDSVVLYRSNTYSVANILDAVSFTTGNEGVDKSFYRLTDDVGYDTVAGSKILDFPGVWGQKSLAEVESAAPGDGWYLLNGAGSGGSPPLTVILDAVTINEIAPANTTPGRVSVATAPAANLTVTLATSDAGEATVTTSVTIPAGQTISGDFIVTGVEDNTADGPQNVSISAAAVGYSNGSKVLSVSDNGSGPALVINEFFARGDADANGDTVNIRQEDEFVEIVNTGTSAMDLSGHTLSDSFGLSHIFPDGTIIGAGCAVVIFGGGHVMEGHTTAFGNTWVQKANVSSFGLSLSDGGDSIILKTPAGEVIRSVVYGAEANVVGNSLTRSPDGSSTAFVESSTVGAPFTPGTTVAGAPFCPLGGALTASLAISTVTEGGAAPALTVTRPAPFGAALKVLFSGGSSTTVTLPLTVVIPAGQASVSVPVTVVEDARDEADTDVTIVAIAPGFLNGSAVLSVLDNDATLPVATTVFINEVNSDTPASGTDEPDEFIEIYTPEGARSLDGFILVLFNGGSQTLASYGAFDLTGYQTNAAGFMTIGDPGPGITFPVAGFTLQNGPDGAALYKAPETLPAIWPPTIPRVENLHNGQVCVYNTGATAGTNALTSAFGALVLEVVREQASNAVTDLTVSRRGDGGGLWKSQAPTPNATNGGSLSGYSAWAGTFAGTGSEFEDKDGDGIANVIEYVAGTSPLEKNDSVLTLTNAGVTASLNKGTGYSDPAMRVVLEASLDLLTWSPTDSMSVDDGATSLTKTFGGNSPLLFWRVKVTPL